MTLLTSQRPAQAAALSGRIQTGPSMLLHCEVLEPQFRYELEHLLPFYVLIEKVLLLEYGRMGVVAPAAVAEIGGLLQQIDGQAIAADPQANMSDIAFAIERFVEQRCQEVVPGWHVDRSRNDFQACAQLMLGRAQVLSIGEGLLQLAESVARLAERTLDLPMPGYTHYQAAQVISPGFYLTAMLDQLIGGLRRLLGVYSAINACPLGSGAMAGQELVWDRQGMAELLGFARAQRHALVGVASREWVLQIASELSLLGVGLSRFVTDFIHWGSSEYGFIDLPDSLAGISSAMPQKKNFPVLERIRGKTAHISAWYVDVLLGQRNTSFANLVEVSKEASAGLLPTCQTMQTTLRLLTTVIEHLRFNEARMQTVCEQEFLGGFSLANYLTLHQAIPHRQAQVIAGSYIVAAMQQQLAPGDLDVELLRAICARHGVAAQISEAQVAQLFSAGHNLRRKVSPGSTNPLAVQALLSSQQSELQQIQHDLQAQRQRNEAAYRRVDDLLFSAIGR